MKTRPDLVIFWASMACLFLVVTAGQFLIATQRGAEVKVTARQIEHAEQAAFFQWIAWQEKKVPELTLAFAVPNGAFLGDAKEYTTAAGKKKRWSPTMNRLKKEGLKNGVPDVVLPVPRKPFHGLFLEFKVQGNGLTTDQEKVIPALEAQGYKVAVVWDCGQAIEETEKYLKGAAW